MVVKRQSSRPGYGWHLVAATSSWPISLDAQPTLTPGLSFGHRTVTARTYTRSVRKSHNPHSQRFLAQSKAAQGSFGSSNSPPTKVRVVSRAVARRVRGLSEIVGGARTAACAVLTVLRLPVATVAVRAAVATKTGLNILLVLKNLTPHSSRSRTYNVPVPRSSAHLAYCFALSGGWKSR